VQATPFETDFPPQEYLEPSDPRAYKEWKVRMQADAAEEENDPALGEDPSATYIGRPRRYVQNFRLGNWRVDFDGELRARRNQGRMWTARTLSLPYDRKPKILAEVLPPAQVPPAQVAQQTSKPFPWGRLPNEVKIKIIDMFFHYIETLKVTAFNIRPLPITNLSTTPAEEAKLARYVFWLVAKVPKALIPEEISKKFDTHKYGPRYWKLDKPSVLLALRTVSKEFDTLITEAFFGKNTFELHDNTATLTRLPAETGLCHRHRPCTLPACPNNARVVAHRWLELMMKHNCLHLIRKLDVDIDLAKGGQTKRHVRRTFQILVCMPNLRRLVITVNMSCFLRKAADKFDPDIHFPFNNVVTTPPPPRTL